MYKFIYPTINEPVYKIRFLSRFLYSSFKYLSHLYTKLEVRKKLEYYKDNKILFPYFITQFRNWTYV